MNISWQTQTAHLECRWSNVGDRIPFEPAWLQNDLEGSDMLVANPILDLTTLSPFGGSDWYAPQRHYSSL